MSDQTTALLIRARSFIERGWCRYVNALDEFGLVIEPTSDGAIAWCAYGAIFAAGTSHPNEVIADALRRFRSVIDLEDIDDFNDAQETVEPVLAAFDRAIAGEHSALPSEARQPSAHSDRPDR